MTRTPLSKLSIAATTLLLLLSSIVTAVQAAKEPYVFDRDFSGKRECEEARDAQDELEIFKLFCVNKVQSFHQCALTCSGALSFEGSVGKCRKNDDCNFYNYNFVDKMGNHLDMNELAKGKATMFAVVPLWESQAQYFYQLLETIRDNYKAETQAFLLPIVVDFQPDPEEGAFEITPYHIPRVTLLNETRPNGFLSHPFMHFLHSVRHSSGYPEFNVYTDRPVLFIISPNGKTIERLVIPTYQQVEESLQRFGVKKVIEGDSAIGEQ
jgi:hypothetical protein